MYVLPRYAQARAALADPGLFCSGQGVGLNDVINGLAAGGNTLTTEAPLVIVDYLAPSLDTTISAIGSAVWLLATYPGQWAALKADPTLAANAFNEVVRLESPIRAFSRVTTADTTVAGHKLAEGSRVMILFASANRDEQMFTDAERFDITRGNAAEHIGFGYGVHGCAGQGLARLEGQAVLRALVTHVDAMELGQPVRAMNNLISAFTSLPLRVQSARPPAGTGP